MLYGLVVPSTQQWIAGAERLSHTPIQSDKLPSDRALTPDVRDAETRVHEIAQRAMHVQTLPERVAPYAEMLTACASCHALKKDWGPQ